MSVETDPTESPEMQLFRQPPEQITAGCAAYMDRVTELRGFLQVFFRMVKAFNPLVLALKASDPAQLNSLAEVARPAVYNFSADRQFVNELALSRAVESFDLYVLTTLRAIFYVQPEMPKSEDSIDVSTIVDLRNFGGPMAVDLQDLARRLRAPRRD